jgi:hypothetical protein
MQRKILNWQFCSRVQNSSIITKTTLCRCLMFSNNPGNQMITCPQGPLAWKGERERERERVMTSYSSISIDNHILHKIILTVQGQQITLSAVLEFHHM